MNWSEQPPQRSGRRTNGAPGGKSSIVFGGPEPIGHQSQAAYPTHRQAPTSANPYSYSYEGAGPQSQGVQLQSHSGFLPGSSMPGQTPVNRQPTSRAPTGGGGDHNPTGAASKQGIFLATARAGAGGAPASRPSGAVTKRDMIWEQKRKAFMDKKKLRREIYAQQQQPPPQFPPGGGYYQEQERMTHAGQGLPQPSPYGGGGQSYPEHFQSGRAAQGPAVGAHHSRGGGHPDNQQPSSGGHYDPQTYYQGQSNDGYQDAQHQYQQERSARDPRQPHAPQQRPSEYRSYPEPQQYQQQSQPPRGAPYSSGHDQSRGQYPGMQHQQYGGYQQVPQQHQHNGYPDVRRGAGGSHEHPSVQGVPQSMPSPYGAPSHVQDPYMQQHQPPPMQQQHYSQHQPHAGHYGSDYAPQGGGPVQHSPQREPAPGHAMHSLQLSRGPNSPLSELMANGGQQHQPHHQQHQPGMAMMSGRTGYDMSRSAYHGSEYGGATGRPGSGRRMSTGESIAYGGATGHQAPQQQQQRFSRRGAASGGGSSQISFG